MSGGVFNSVWKGSQIEHAVGVVINSEVTSAQLQVLRGLVFGSGVAGKAMVLDQNRNYSGVENLTVTVLRSDYLHLANRTTDPVSNPATGTLFVYIKNGELYIKNNAGVITRVGGGVEAVFEFANTTTVPCVHNFGKKYPIVEIVDLEDKTLVGQKYYQNENQLTVMFNNPQSGKIILRAI